MPLSVKWEGKERVLIRIGKITPAVTIASVNALLANAPIVESEAKRRCPLNTDPYASTRGALRKSVKARVLGLSLEVSADARNPRDGYYYGNAVEFGFHHKQAGWVSPQPFIRPTVIQQLSKIKQDIARGIRV